MEQKELQKLLNQPYNQENWKKIVMDVFPNVSILATPKVFPINNPKIEKFSQLGNVRLHDGKNLALFELILNDSVNLSKNRVELNNEISKYIDQEQIHGVLSVFEQGNDDYRFTFSARSTEFDEQEGDFVPKKTDTKRFTYVLGKNESCKTPSERFFQLSQKKNEADIFSVQNAFSVEQVSKEFFKKYTEQFKKFWTYIAAKKEYAQLFDHSDKDKKELKIRDFTKKLLGRIVFLHFLQKKGWMGCNLEYKDWQEGDKQFMQHYFEEAQNKETFHSHYLYQLFFNALNLKRENDIFSIKGTSKQLNNTKIPYLNGGLFDTDEDISKKINFPETYFTDLFGFFGQYNFTIDENDPNDHEIGIDPEMLGHIFENLLEDNKDKGAYYTPKVIVQYMCQESLIEYLKTSLNIVEEQKVETVAIEKLVREKLAQEISDFDAVAPIAKALYEVKICDPAIGSGAFPMGMLNEIYQIIEVLHTVQPDAVAPIWQISDTFWQPHLVKKNIIQHSIYGVDIESGAVDIARLRFWLALIVDETEPLPLPNLDYKIMQGNSLLESFEGIDLSQISDSTAYDAVYETDQIDLFSGEAKKKVSISLNFEDIKSLMDDYFNANDPETKKELHKNIDVQVLNHIQFTLLQHKQELLKNVKKVDKKLKLDEAAAVTWQQKEKIRTISKDAKELIKLKKALEELNKKEIALGQLSNSNERPFFLWHLFFKEVFDTGGFDIVIGNPPYVNIYLIPEIVKPFYSSNYTTAYKKYDLYVLFFEKGLQILKEKGNINLITSNKYFSQPYGKNLRTLFLSYKINEIINFRFNIFNATVDTAITSIQKSSPNISMKFKDISNIKDYKSLFDGEYDLIDLNLFNQSNEKNFRLELNQKDLIIINKIKLKSRPLSDICYVNYGCRLISKDGSKKKKNYIFDIQENEKLKPFIEGRNVKKYKISGNKYVNYSPKEHYLALFPELFESKKLVSKDVVGKDGVQIAFDDIGLYNDHTTINAVKWSELNHVTYKNVVSELTQKDIEVSKSYDYLFLLAILNSQALNYYFNKLFNIDLHFYPGTLQKMPIPKIQFNNSIITKNINEIINKSSKNIDSSNQQNEINTLIYKYFDFTFKEVLIVEPEFSDRMSKNEFKELALE